MRLFLDSSYLIYLRYSESDKVFNYVTNLLKESVERGDHLFVNMIIIDETLWVLTKKYKVPLDEVLELTDRLMPLLEVVPIEYTDYDIMKESMMNYGLKPSDVLHIASMNKTKVQHIVSEDNEFDRVSWIKRIWLNTITMNH